MSTKISCLISLQSWLDLLQGISGTNIVTLLLAISVMLVLIVFKEIIEPALKTRFKINTAIPIDIFVLILGTFISYILKLHKMHSISIMGEIPTGLPSVEVPRLDLLPSLIPDAFVISIVTFTISLSLGKLYAKKYKYQVRPNQELIAMGTANLVSSFFSCFPCSASLSRSSVLEKAGAKTQLAGVVTSIVILIVLLFLGPFLYHLPKCVLASIILVALKGMFVQMSDLKKYWKISRFEGISWVVTFLSVIFLDVDIGLVVGVICSVLIILVQFVL
jgi:sulfate/bicarbonate/oxalate exchanger SAT-1, putative (fragment)